MKTQEELDEQIKNITEMLENDDISDNERQVYEDMLERISEEGYLEKQEAINKSHEEAFEASKTTYVESEEEINEILAKYNLTGNKSAISLIRVMEEQYGFIILSMVDTNMKILSRLKLSDIIFNVKKNVGSNEFVVKVDETTLSEIKETKNFDLIDKYLMDSYIDYLNELIEKHDNVVVSALMTSINIISEASFAPRGLVRYHAKFF
jgi:hypothetical protein